MAERNPQQKKPPSDHILDSETLEEEVDECLAHHRKSEFIIPLEDQHKPLKQHGHTPQLNVILQSKEDHQDNQK